MPQRVRQTVITVVEPAIRLFHDRSQTIFSFPVPAAVAVLIHVARYGLRRRCGSWM